MIRNSHVSKWRVAINSILHLNSSPLSGTRHLTPLKHPSSSSHHTCMYGVPCLGGALSSPPTLRLPISRRPGASTSTSQSRCLVPHTVTKWRIPPDSKRSFRILKHVVCVQVYTNCVVVVSEHAHPPSAPAGTGESCSPPAVLGTSQSRHSMARCTRFEAMI